MCGSPTTAVLVIDDTYIFIQVGDNLLLDRSHIIENYFLEMSKESIPTKKDLY